MSDRGRGIRRLFRLRPSGWDDATDVEEEVRAHLAMRVEQLVEEGWELGAAQVEARRRFSAGSDALRALHAAARERNRRVRTRERWASWWQDARHAGRALAKDRMLAVFVVLTLAFGIGMNVTSFSLVDRLLLRGPEHVERPEELLRLFATVSMPAVGEQTSAWIPWPVYTNLREGLTGFTDIGAYRVQGRVVGSRERGQTVRAGQAAPGFFELLGVRALRGRFFTQGDAASDGPVAVLGAQYWQTVLGGDPQVIGTTILVDETAHTIIGIAPAGFAGIEPRRIDVWVPTDARTVRTMNWHVVGRMRPGTSVDAVTAEAQSIFGRTSEDAPRWYRGAVLFAGPIHYSDTGRERFEATMARWLAAVSAVILLVAMANVVSLLLVRLARRRRELAVRVALGSGRGRVIRLLALEGELLAAASGLASLVVARIAEPIVRRTLFADEAIWSFSVLDLRLLGIAFLIVLVTAVVTGLAPALQAWGPGLSQALRSGAHGGGSGNARVRGVLTVVQAALSVMLLVGAGLFYHSLGRIRALDLGVDGDAVIAATAHLPGPSAFTSEAFAQSREQEIAVYRRLVDEARTVRGVERASFAVGLPLDGGSFSAAVFVDGMDSVPSLPGGGPYASAVGPGYFETAGTSLLRGRVFTDSDREGSERVIIINETMAQRLWPAGDPLDACVRLDRSDGPCYRVVGIVEDVHRVGLREQPSLQYYVPIGQQSMFGGATLLVRPVAAGSVSWPDLHRAMLSADPTIRAVEMRWLRAAIDGEVRPLRLGMVTFGLSGGLALVVVVIGLYGLMSYMVAWRTREIGIRLAIGATAPQVTRMVIGSGASLAGIGVAIGLLVSFWAGRWVEPHLYETSGSDPLVYATVAAILVLVAILAGWLPARRAIAIRPTEALRAE